jgi:hypothetical protein
MKNLITHKDGSVSIMTTVSDDINVLDEMDKLDPAYKETIDFILKIDEEDIPSDRYFRDAWVHKDEKIHVDLDKSLLIHQNVLREIRRPKLEALDLEFTRALESNDEQKKSEISIKKNELRDITVHPELLSAQTPEQIKNFRPAVLFD